MADNLQDTFAAQSICYGCGPANPQGFHIKSRVEGDLVVADWTPQTHHQAFLNVLNGGVIGTLLDCHCNWAAAWYLMQAQQLKEPPCTVTAEYTIRLLKPTPIAPLQLVAELKEIKGNRATIHGELRINNIVYDTCHGVFVAVNESHPAFHRW